MSPDPDPLFKAERIQIQSGSTVLETKNSKKIIAEKYFLCFFTKIAIYLSLGLHKGRPSYRKNLQPSKENIQHFTTLNFFTFFYFLGHFFPPGSGSGSTDLTESGSNPDPKKRLFQNYDSPSYLIS
jgi:hypothetical protein